MDRREALTGQDEPFLARWSRRKQEAREQAQASPDTEPVAEAAPGAASAAPPADAPLRQEPEPRVLTDEDMPPIESLTDDADYSGFLSAGVSEVLRRKALRRLFSSAKFNVTDGLDDFAEDYTQFAPLGDVVTADMRHRMERLLDKLRAGEADNGKGLAAAEAGAHEAPAPVDDAARTTSDALAAADQSVENPEPQRREGAEGQS